MNGDSSGIEWLFIQTTMANRRNAAYPLCRYLQDEMIRQKNTFTGKVHPWLSQGAWRVDLGPGFDFVFMSDFSSESSPSWYRLSIDELYLQREGVVITESDDDGGER